MRIATGNIYLRREIKEVCSVDDDNRAFARRQILMAISWAGGFLGIDRFYQGQIGWGLLKLVTVGGFLIWWLTDAFIYTVEAGRK